jgi:hypothetical protein
MKAYGENESTDPLILNLSDRWKRLVEFVPPPLYSQGTRNPVPIEYNAGREPQDVFLKKANLLSVSGFDPLIAHPVACTPY